MRLRDYFFALQPRRLWWFASFSVAGFGVSTVAAYLIAAEFLEPDTATLKVLAVIIGVLVVLLLALFVSGFNAWRLERQRNDDKWPRLNFEQRQALAEAVKNGPALPEVAITHDPSTDCAQLAADIYDALPDRWILFDNAARQVPSGITMIGRSGDVRASALRDGLKFLGIHSSVQVEERATRLAILIGPKVIL